MSASRIPNIFSMRFAAIFVVVLTAFAISIGDADARRKRQRIGHGSPPPFSHIVLDAKSGRVLEAFKADERRYPASLTKVMTLYLLFEQIESGKIKLGTPLNVSRYAASRPPSKLGLKPGAKIRVEDAIKAVVTRSANDVAVVIAEAIGGSESQFAKMMTDKARALGMTRTHYANASGLPNPNQLTTAHDQAVLGRAIQERFPREYRYFSTHTFVYRGRAIANHNHLLGTVAGVDGIKTGYTNASGYNLVSSVHRNSRRIVAVVLGGRTSRSRDAFMSSLIQQYIGAASTGRTAELNETPAAPVAAPGAHTPMPPASPVRTIAAAPAPAVVAIPVSLVVNDGRRVASKVSETRTDGSELANVRAVVRTISDNDSAVRAQVIQVMTTVPNDFVALGGVPTQAPPSEKIAQLSDKPSVSPVIAAGVSVYPSSLPYLLAVFIGSIGSLAVTLWLMISRGWPWQEMLQNLRAIRFPMLRG